MKLRAESSPQPEPRKLNFAEKILNDQIARELKKRDSQAIINQIITKMQSVLDGSDEVEKRRWERKLGEFGLGDLEDTIEKLIYVKENPDEVIAYLGLKKAAGIAKNIKLLMGFAGIRTKK